MARELAPTTLIRTVAERLGSPRAVALWLQSLPQTDDEGDELYRYLACDVAQRVRLLPDDPNCFERSFAALALLEALDPLTPRMLVTVNRPVRHTGVVEKRESRWAALDLFPRRNFDWEDFGKDLLQGAHRYVGKPLLTFWLGKPGEEAADLIGEQENELIGRGKKSEKKPPPPPPSKPQVPGAGAPRTATKPQGGTNAEESQTPSPSVTARAVTAPGVDGDKASRVAAEEAKRWGFGDA